MANVKLLEYIRLLVPLSGENVSLLLSHFENRVLQKGEAILKEGQICTHFYFVESGYLRTFYNKDGVEINMNFHFEGSITSDQKSAKTLSPSEFTIEAGEKSEIWIINRKLLGDLCLANPEIMHFGRRAISRMLLDLNTHSHLFKIYSPTERYHYIEKNSPHLLQRVSLSNLASYLGMNRRTLTRIRGKK